jgi:hypothetical protein
MEKYSRLPFTDAELMAEAQTSATDGELVNAEQIIREGNLGLLYASLTAFKLDLNEFNECRDGDKYTLIGMCCRCSWSLAQLKCFRLLMLFGDNLRSNGREDCNDEYASLIMLLMEFQSYNDVWLHMLVLTVKVLEPEDFEDALEETGLSMLETAVLSHDTNAVTMLLEGGCRAATVHGALCLALQTRPWGLGMETVCWHHAGSIHHAWADCLHGADRSAHGSGQLLLC